MRDVPDLPSVIGGQITARDKTLSRANADHDNAHDARLLEAFSHGDMHAFEMLWHRYRGLVHRQIRLAGVWQPDAVDDISQNVFVKVYRFIGAFRGDASFPSWLTRVAINEARTHRSRFVSRRDWWADSGEGTAQSLLEGLQEPIRFDQAFLQRQSIRGALTALPTDLRRLAVLRYVRGMKYQEIAQLVGCPRGTVESKLFRARLKLRQLLLDSEAASSEPPSS